MEQVVIIIVLVAGFAIWLLGQWLNSPRYKGKAGEARVVGALSQLPEGYYQLSDVVFKTNHGTTQIDHIVVSKYGVFTIETKNYRGEIYGNDDREQWTQMIVTDVTYAKRWWKTYTYVTKNHLYNPVKQSKGHAAQIKRLLGNDYRHVPVIPIVAFAGEADISKVETRRHVVYVSQLPGVLGQYRAECLNDEQVLQVYDLLQQSNIRDQVKDREHVASVYNARFKKEAMVASGHCPNCGGTLVYRNGRYGSFYGCSNYPKCRFTKND